MSDTLEKFWGMSHIPPEENSGLEKEPFIMRFTDTDEMLIGVLKENDEGVLDFEGDSTECAEIFFGKVVVLQSKVIHELCTDILKLKEDKDD